MNVNIVLTPPVVPEVALTLNSASGDVGAITFTTTVSVEVQIPSDMEAT